MENILYEFLPTDIVNYVITNYYYNDYKKSYDSLIWQLNIYIRDSLYFEDPIKKSINIFKYKFVVGQHFIYPIGPDWTSYDYYSLMRDIRRKSKYYKTYVR
jgi:hypothetical protein